MAEGVEQISRALDGLTNATVKDSDAGTRLAKDQAAAASIAREQANMAKEMTAAQKALNVAGLSPDIVKSMPFQSRRNGGWWRLHS